MHFSLENNKIPILTTKKVAFKTMATELMWFLMGDTNIKYLVDNNCHIWDGDAWKNYINEFRRTCPKCPEITKEEFINKIKNDHSLSIFYFIILIKV